jgi:hypothetical protein
MIMLHTIHTKKIIMQAIIKSVCFLFVSLSAAAQAQELLETVRQSAPKARWCNEHNKKQEAIHHYEQAIAQEPNNLQARLELGNLYFEQENFPQALTQYRSILNYAPDCVSVLFNAACAETKLGNYRAVIPLCEHILLKDPAHPYAQQSLGIAYLATGDFAQGWYYFEDRWKKPRIDIQHCREYVHTHADLSGKTFLVTQEWGFGDTFMMMRFVRELKVRGARIILMVKKELISLLALCPYIDSVISFQTAAPAYDFSTSMLSLPWIFDIYDETKIPTVPALCADTKLTTFWRQKISSVKKNYTIGICWQTDGGKTTCLSRNIPLEIIALLADLEGVTIYSLQKNASAELLKINNHLIIDLGKDFDTVHGAFMDTAALMKNLDLVITIDTAIAHLAGALGVPVWLLLSAAPDWRWMLDRIDSPWYPTMRIFRQQIPYDWQSLIASVGQELKKIISHKKLCIQKDLL